MPLRPGPLQEISMDTNHATTLPHSSSSKRLHSPPTSPAKRRVLTQERFQNSSRLSEVYSDSLGPVKKLDFGFDPCMLAKSLSNTSLDSSPSTESLLSPSNSPAIASMAAGERPSLSAKSCIRSLQQRYSLMARELPPPCDPTSAHYPGFHIHRDSHVPVYENSGLAETLASQNSRDKEGLKENNAMAARKKIRKSLIPGTASPSTKPPTFLTPSEQHKGMQKLLPGSPGPSTSWLP